jgi:hypothetical protein
MKLKVAMLLGPLVAVWAGTLMAGTISFSENWDNYEVGYDDLYYVANWVADHPGSGRYLIDEPRISEWSSPYVLKVKKEDPFCITHDLHEPLTTPSGPVPAALPPGAWVVATDDYPLYAQINIDVGNYEPSIDGHDAFLELSRGGAHAPTTDDTLVPDVVAFGWAYGVEYGGVRQTSLVPRVYDGLLWADATDLTVATRWNNLELTITTSELVIEQTWTNGGASGTHTFARYLPNAAFAFDTISVRTIFNSKRLFDVDDVTLSGGLVTWPGDFDLDGDVDEFDLLDWQNGYGGPGTYAEGDADLDGDVDAFDLLIWQQNYGKSSAPGLASVPEPSTLVLLGVGAVVLALFARRRR